MYCQKLLPFPKMAHQNSFITILQICLLAELFTLMNLSVLFDSNLLIYWHLQTFGPVSCNLTNIRMPNGSASTRSTGQGVVCDWSHTSKIPVRGWFAQLLTGQFTSMWPVTNCPPTSHFTSSWPVQTGHFTSKWPVMTSQIGSCCCRKCQEYAEMLCRMVQTLYSPNSF